MYRLLVLYIFLLVSCTTTNRALSYTVQTKPVYKIDPEPQKIILLNTCNFATKKIRDKKEELFISLTDSLMLWASGKITDKTGIRTQVLTGYTDLAGNTDSTVLAQLKEYNASHAIILYSFNVFFNQTHVDVVKNLDGKKDRTAYYDIVADIDYSFYSIAGLLKNKTILKKRFHSSRSVISGLLAVGPNVVAQRKDARDIMLENGQDFLNYFFPGEAGRTRIIFTGKGFEAVNAALARNNYDAALTENLRFIDDSNKEKAAKACYNCAVLFDRKGQPGEAKTYLQQSLSLFNLREARSMLNDFEE
ncbi:MAG TPA: hypothetical protein VF487_02015 [Chitinophagaceae bacterium]